jgi:hypothetical protein
MELLRVPERMSSRSSSGRALLILDEFGEVMGVPGEPDALMRSAFRPPRTSPSCLWDPRGP